MNLTFVSLTPKFNQHIYKPIDLWPKLGEIPFHWFLRYGVHKVFKKQIVHSRTCLNKECLRQCSNSGKGIKILFIAIYSLGQKKLQSSLQSIPLTRRGQASTPRRSKCQVCSKHRPNTASQVHGCVHYAVPSSKLRCREPLYNYWRMSLNSKLNMGNLPRPFSPGAFHSGDKQQANLTSSSMPNHCTVSTSVQQQTKT